MAWVLGAVASKRGPKPATSGRRRTAPGGRLRRAGNAPISQAAVRPQSCGGADAHANTPGSPAPLIPRAKLFGNPTRAQGQISPDGRWLSWLAPKDGVLNIWVAPVGDIGAARVITDDKKRGIRFHAWANSSAHVLYMQDEGGTEDWHIYAVPIDGGPARDLHAVCRRQRPHPGAEPR